MRYLILSMILVLPILGMAQRKKKPSLTDLNRIYYERIMETEEANFKATTALERWKEEPYVVLSQLILLSVETSIGYWNYQSTSLVRKRILIQDKSSIEEFSTFYFQENEMMGVKLIKPNGEEIEIDISDAISVDTEVPRVYQREFSSDSYYKIAVPNLEVGDIIDYYSISTDNAIKSPSLVTTISYTYPVGYQKFILDFDPSFDVEFKTYNDAPAYSFEKKHESALYLNKDVTVKRKDRYELIDTLRDAQTVERWDYPYLYQPLLKFLVYRTNFLYQPATTWREFFSKTIKAEYPKGSDIERLKKSIHKRLSKQGTTFKEMSKEAKINHIYRTIRYEYAMFDRNNSLYSPLVSSYFVYLYTHFLTEYKIESNYVVAMPRSYGDIRETLLENELEYGVYIPMTDKIYWAMNGFSVPEEAKPYVSGIYGYQKIKQSKMQPDSIYIPSTVPENHVIKTTIETSFNDDNSLNLATRMAYTGGHKAYYIGLLLANTDYLEKERIALSSEKEQAKIAKRKTKAEKDEERVRKRSEIDELKEEEIVKLIEDDFEVEELKYYRLVETGTTVRSPALIWEYEFTNNDLVKKAGPNLVFDLGRLITSQVELEEEEIEERKNDIQYDFARTYQHEIIVTIPEGYVVKGTDQFNMNVDHACGSFVSTARQEGDQLKVEVSKVYKQQTVDAEDWSKLVEMLEAAYQFTQQKVVLTKAANP